MNLPDNVKRNSAYAPTQAKPTPNGGFFISTTKGTLKKSLGVFGGSIYDQKIDQNYSRNEPYAQQGISIVKLLLV